MSNTQIAPTSGLPWRAVGWAVPVVLLTIPWLANFPWTLSDYVFMGVLFAVAGGLTELGIKASAGNVPYRFGMFLAVLAAFLLIWVNAAVGFLGNEDNPANLMFAGVILTAIAGAVGAGLRPAGMGRAMFLTAAVQVTVAVAGWAAGWASPGFNGVYEVVMGSVVFGSLWILSASMFRKADNDATAGQ